MDIARNPGGFTKPDSRVTAEWHGTLPGLSAPLLRRQRGSPAPNPGNRLTTGWRFLTFRHRLDTLPTSANCGVLVLQCVTKFCYSVLHHIETGFKHLNIWSSSQSPHHKHLTTKENTTSSRLFSHGIISFVDTHLEFRLRHQRLQTCPILFHLRIIGKRS